MTRPVARRTLLRAGAAGAAAWLGGLRVTDLLAAVPPSSGSKFRPAALPTPSTPDDLAYLTIAEASALLASGDVTPLDLVDACLSRIERFDPQIRAYVGVFADEARAAAAEATDAIARDGQRTPLHGIPIAHKDLYDIEGYPTRAGSKVLSDEPPAARDATVVARLRRAGAIVLGKTNTHEFAFGVWTPPTSNPWDQTKIPGGSSGGSAAAMASGMALGTTGTDTGASIRLPAGLCNAVGFKPTFGRSSRAGVVPLCWTLDHTGPIARAVEDCALMLNEFAGPDPRDPTAADVRARDFTRGLGSSIAGRRVGVPTRVFFDGVEAETESLVMAAAEQLAALGAEVVPFDPPASQYEAATAYLVIQLVEPLAAHETFLRKRPHDYQTQTQVLLGLGAAWHGQHYMRAQRLRTINIQEWMRIFEDIDVVLCPVAPRPAPTKDEAQASGVFDLVNYTSLFDFNGCPSISVPAGFTSAGLPVGVMLSARPFDEARLLQVAYAYQEATGFTRQRPPLT